MRTKPAFSRGTEILLLTGALSALLAVIKLYPNILFNLFELDKLLKYRFNELSDLDVLSFNIEGTTLPHVVMYISSKWIMSSASSTLIRD